MDIQDFKKAIMSEIDKVENELDGQMCIQWQLEGQKAAYKKVKELIADLIEKTYGEVLKQMTDAEIHRKGKAVAECYMSHNVNGNQYYDIHQMEGAFSDGAKWILAQLKV